MRVSALCRNYQKRMQIFSTKGWLKEKGVVLLPILACAVRELRKKLQALMTVLLKKNKNSFSSTEQQTDGHPVTLQQQYFTMSSLHLTLLLHSFSLAKRSMLNLNDKLQHTWKSFTHPLNTQQKKTQQKNPLAQGLRAHIALHQEKAPHCSWRRASSLNNPLLTVPKNSPAQEQIHLTGNCCTIQERCNAIT